MHMQEHKCGGHDWMSGDSTVAASTAKFSSALVWYSVVWQWRRPGRD